MSEVKKDINFEATAEKEPGTSQAEEEKDPQLGLNKSQKIAAALLAFFAFVIVIVWAFQFKNSLNSPFIITSRNNDRAETGDDICPNGNCGEADNSEEALRAKDTDQDGLNDWEELNIYGTSPYLEDSDSDGFSDKEEIDTDNDPNCPFGRDCLGYEPLYNEDENVSQETEAAGDLLESYDLGLEIVENTENRELIDDILSGKTDVETLRRLLMDAGMDEAALEQISDEDLLKSYEQVLDNN